MKTFLYIYRLIVFLCVISFFPFTSWANDSCKIQSVQATVNTPPLCRGKSVNALLSATTAEPDFSDVDDILQGERSLLPVDDLVVMNPTGVRPSQACVRETSVRDGFFLTANKNVNSFINKGQLIAGQCTTNCSTAPVKGSFLYGAPSAQQTNSVRIFNIDRDVVVTYSVGRWMGGIASSDCLGISIITQDPLGLISVPDITINDDTVYSIDPYFLQSAVGDFNQDGYEDILIIKGGIDSSMFVITAEDPDLPALGLKIVGPFELFPAINGFSAMNAMSSPVIGDFNGDTIIDVAWVGSRGSDLSPYNIFFASICPGPTANIPLCKGKSVFETILNPLSSQVIELDTFANANAEFAYPASALAAGDFSPDTVTNVGDDLMVVYGQAGTGGWAVEYYSFNSSMAPILRDSLLGQAKIYNAYAESAQLDRSQPTEQVVMALQAQGSCPLWVFSFDQKGFIQHVSDWRGPASGAGSCSGDFQNPNSISLNGMALGRYTDEIPLTAFDLDPQIATFYSDHQSRGSNSYNVQIFEAKPDNNFIAKFINNFPGNNNNLLSSFGAPNPNRGGSFIRVGDLQGRSLVLGAPSVVRMPKFTQVDVVQGSPPMHGDYIQTLNENSPLVNNFSIIPETFNTAFTTQTSSTTSSTERSTSSYTYSFMQGFDFNAKWPAFPVIGGEFQLDLSFSAEQLYDCNVSQVNSEYSSKTFGLQVVSGFGDQLIFTQQRQNIYYYPVIGNYVCPDGMDDCSESDKEPLFIQFSAPDQIYKDRINEINAEFYQPVHEPGNIFTYPWTTAQLLTRFGSVSSDLLTPSNPVGWFTDTSPNTEFADWTQGSGNECTTGTQETLTFNESLAIGYGNSRLEQKRSGANLKFNFDFSQSSSNGSLLSNISELSDSTGVSTLKTNSFLDPPNYQYRVQTYIFGEKFPVGVWDTTDPAGDEANINSTGALKVAFTVNPTITGAGNWWQSGPGANPYKAFPDIALNHPNQWRIVGLGIENNQEPPSNCRPNSINENRATCLLKRQPASNPSLLWSSGFYQMRGFIVQVGDEATGPQMVSSVVGDNVHLTARIYNYSFKNFDPGTVIKAQFYRQQWDPVNVEPIGDSTLIDEVVTTPVPAYNPSGTSSPPNWKTVSTSFNTEEEGMQGDTWWIFWVLVWPQHHEGNLVAELPGHGLPNGFKPGEVYKSIQDVPLELVTVTESGMDVETSFTNNLGFWKQAFYVAPRAIAEESFTSADLGEIIIENLSIERDNIFVDDQILVEADIWSLGARSEALAVTLDEGHPDDTDQIYDIEVMSHIRADESNKFSVLYQPKQCGQRDLYLSAGPEGPSAPTATMASIALNVICRPGDTNLDGQLIGNNGQPVSMNSNCSLAPASGIKETAVFENLLVYTLIPTLLVMRRRYRRK